MKTILLWDQKFPDRRARRLSVADAVAFALVRAGVAAAADPADAGALALGAGALDPIAATPSVQIVLQHGNGSSTARVTVPVGAAAIAVGAGVGAAVSVPVASVIVTPTPTPTLTLSGALAYAADAAAGVTVATIANVPAGVTPTISPADWRMVVAGDAASGWKVVKGMTASSVGTISITVSASGATSATQNVTVSAAAAIQMIAANRLRLGVVWNLCGIAAAVFGFDRARIRTGNSTTNGTFTVDNSVLDETGVAALPPGGASADNKIRRFQAVQVSNGTVIPIMYNGVVVSPETGMVPILGGQKFTFKPQTPLLPNTEYFIDMWDECPVGNYRPGVYANESRLAGEATKTAAAAFDAAGTAAPTTLTSSYIHMNACLFTAEGITGSSVAEFFDSLEDQSVLVPGAVDWGYIRASLSSTTGGFVPNMGTGRYSASGVATYQENFQSLGRRAILTWWDEIAVLLGQPNTYPFNTVVFEHFRNNASSGRVVAKGFMDRLAPKFTAPNPRIFIVSPIPAVQPNSTDGNTTEASQTPLVTAGNPYNAGGERDLYTAELRAGATGGRNIILIDLATFVRGATDIRAWPSLGSGGLLKTAMTAASPTGSVKVTGTGWRVGDYLVFDPGSLTTAGMDNTGKRVTAVVDNGDGTFQLSLRNTVAKDYPVDTVVRRTPSFDGTHESVSYLGDMGTWFLTNAKPLFFA